MAERASTHAELEDDHLLFDIGSRREYGIRRVLDLIAAGV